jgi:hypothetical protein
LMTHEKVRRDKSGSYVHFFYMFINVCYELMIGWNYGSGNDRNGEKMAPCFPRGHFARWCLLHGLSKRPWLTRPKDAFCRYNMLPSQDAERFVFFLFLRLFFCSAIVYASIVPTTIVPSNHKLYDLFLTCHMLYAMILKNLKLKLPLVHGEIKMINCVKG